jgi:hypothetical protein
VLGETFEMHALPGAKTPLSIHSLPSAAGSAAIPTASPSWISKGKVYEFSGLFRRDRQYFDYDLLGNPNIPAGSRFPSGPRAPTGSLRVAAGEPIAVPVQHGAPHDRHQPDDPSAVEGDLSRGVLAEHLSGPEPEPQRLSFAKYDAMLQEYQRNSTDDFTGAIDWKPVRAPADL